jgi:hypothetical protein
MGRLGWRGRRWVLALTAITTLVLLPFQTDAQQQQRSPVTGLFDVRIGGYVQTNVTWDSDENQDDNPSALRELAVQRDTPQHKRETLRWASTRTRLFIDVRGPEWYGAKTRAYTEFDWDGLKLGDDGESSATAAHTPRLRHAYARFDWPRLYLTIGQTTLIFNSVVSSESELEGVSSSHGDMTSGSRNRAPQFILGYVVPIGEAKLELAGSVARHATDQNPDAPVDNAQSLNDSGARSALPALQGLIKGSLPLFGRDVILAVSGYWGEATLTADIASGSRTFRKVHSTGLALEGILPLPAFAGITPELRGAAFTADNMSGWNLGHNGLTSTTATPAANPREITATGGWVEGNLDLPMNFAVGVGYGRVADDRDWVIKRGGDQRVVTNDAGWLYGQWKTGPVLTELLYGKIYTTRLDTGTRREHDTDSDAVHLVFRYRF